MLQEQQLALLITCAAYALQAHESHVLCPPLHFVHAIGNADGGSLLTLLRVLTAVCAQGWIAQRDLGFIYQPTFAHSYSVTNSTEDLRQALAAAEVRTSNSCAHVTCPPDSVCSLA
jgi:hypothetical protein